MRTLIRLIALSLLASAPACSTRHSADEGPGGAHVATAELHSKRKSGKEWVKDFPDTKNVADLEDDFEKKVKEFINAVKVAGVNPRIETVYRPPERAHLMHWCWKICKQNHNAQKVDEREGVEIDWWHGDQKLSEAAAQEMHDAYAIRKDLKVPPALSSRHTEGKAIDLIIEWSGDLKIKNKDKTDVTITSEPRNSSNPDLIKVAATYGVIHFTEAAKDVNHWSTDGR